MALPLKLKSMNLFNEGQSWLGEVASITLPKLGRKFEGYRGGGMDAEVQIDMGGEPLELEATYGGPMRAILRQFAAPGMATVYQRFQGLYQDDSSDTVARVEVTVRGRHQEIDMGEQKPGEGGEFKVKSALVYYRLDWDGRTEIEIDVLNMVYLVDGVDQLAAQRAAIL